MSYFSLLYRQVGPIDALKVVSTDAVLWVSTSGNDTFGTGTTGAPFQSLKRALNYAREHLILGNFTLTIRLLPGVYTLNENLDLYHPQGSNIVIEGDPSAFTQRTVWRVQNYTWNLSNFAGGGHTGTLSLFDGTTSGCTFHGFTSAHNGTHFAIVNAAVGSRSGYETNGRGVSAPGSSSYDPVFWGDRFFNHGYSYEDGNGILGLGKILDAGSSPYTLSAQFTNLNYDGRCPAWHMNGGIGNGSPTWAGIGSNYPETQYSQPDGYYGNAAWRNESGSVQYPAKPNGTSYITPDPLLVSTYPVVIQANYGTNSGSMYLKNGTLKGLRNILFTTTQAPYGGSGANHSQAISAFTDNGLAHDTNGTALVLENATIGIRHLGFNGMGTAISAHDSKIVKYTETTTDTAAAGQSTSAVGGTVRYAVLGSLDNAPVICTANCGNSIVAKNSTIDFTDGSGMSREYLTDYRDSSVYLSALSKPISLFGSKLKATSVVANTHSMVPSFKMDIAVPVFSGLTATVFTQYAGSTGFWSAYPLVKAYLNLSASGRQEIGVINFVTQSSLPVSGTSGLTLNASYVGGITPSGYARYTLHGLKTTVNGLGGLAYMTAHDVRNGITTPYGLLQVGGTLEVEFYGNNNGSNVSSYYGLGRNGIAVRGLSGSTLGISGTTAAQFSNLLQSFSSYGVDGTYLGNYFQNRKTALQAFDGSAVTIEKALVVDNGGAVPVEIAKNSTLLVGDGIVSANKSLGATGAGQTDGSFGSLNYNTGALCITGYAYAGVHCWDNSQAIVGTVFTKHPTAVNCFEENDLSVGNKVLKLEQCSKGILGGVYSLLCPGSSYVISAQSGQTNTTSNSGYWKSRTGIGYGFIPFNLARQSGFISVDKNSHMILEVASGRKVFHFDGGNPNFSGAPTPRNAAFFTASNSSIILVGDVLQTSSAYTSTASPFLGRFTWDTRGMSAGNRLASRSTGTSTTYNTQGGTTGGVRAWAADVASYPTLQVLPINIGSYLTMLMINTNGQNDIVPQAGVTYCSSFSGFSRVLGI